MIITAQAIRRPVWAMRPGHRSQVTGHFGDGDRWRTEQQAPDARYGWRMGQRPELQEAGHAACKSTIRNFSFYPAVDANLFDQISRVFLIGH